LEKLKVNVLIRSFEEHSLIWILISAGVGGLIGALVKFAFEEVLGPKLRTARTAKASLRMYTYPILRAAYTLVRRLQNFVRFADKNWFDNTKDDYYRLSTLYLLGCYFGWCKILENEAFLEYETSNKKAKLFNIQYNRVFKGITGFYYFKDVNNDEMSSVEEATVPRMALTAIGELMIKESKGSGKQDKSLCVIDFVEFSKSYRSSEDFKKWFSYIENLLSNVNRSKRDAKWNRLNVFAANLDIFVTFLDPSSRQTAPRTIYYHKNLHAKVRSRLVKEIEESGFSYLLQK
jgi:hypothetical protein